MAHRIDHTDNPQDSGVTAARQPARRPPPRLTPARYAESGRAGRAGTKGSPAPAGPVANATLRIVRFDAVQRAAHWANAALFGLCMLTALPLYFSQIEQIVGRHVLVEQVHVWSGVALPIPLLISLLGPWGKRMRRDVRRFNRWTHDEVRWLRTLGRDPRLAPDKFNPGQKLNAIFIGGSIVVMLGTGSVMYWFSYFPVSWRTGATFVHEVLAWAVFIVVAGHIVMAITHRDALRSMWRGWVTAAWARLHAPDWAAEEIDRQPAAVVVGVGVDDHRTPAAVPGDLDLTVGAPKTGGANSVGLKGG